MTTSLSFSESLLKAARQMGSEDWYLRQIRLREDDIWLASYPRSGSHFVRFILVSARHFLRSGKFPEDLAGMKTIPDIHGGRLEFAQEIPRIFKTHFPFDPRYRRVIHLLRDPRDVIVSYFHYSKGLPHLFLEPVSEKLKLPQFVALFLRGNVWPGDIKMHTASYAAHAGVVEYTRIHYERLLAEPREEYSRLLRAAGIALPADVLGALIAHTSFSSMRRLHRPDTARAGMVETNPNYILRNGIAGQHAQVLRDKTRERIATELGDYLREYGYS